MKKLSPPPPAKGMSAFQELFSTKIKSLIFSFPSKLFSYFLVFTLFVVTQACEKNGVKNEFKDQSLLSEDKNFVTLVTETHDYLKFLATNLKANAISQAQLNSQLVELQARNLSFDKQMNEIDVIFNMQVSVRLKNHMVTYRKSMDQLNRLYGVIDPNTLIKETEEVMSKIVPKQSEGEVRILRADDCGWRYYGCAGAATAGAILCHAGCDTTALATTAGLGIPACVLACGAVQAWMIVECADRFCE